MNKLTATRKRPIGVWIISSLWIIGSVWTLLTYDFATSQVVPTPDGQPDLVIDVTAFDHFIGIIAIGINIAAAIALFLLRKAAFYLFAINLGLSIVGVIQFLRSDFYIDFGPNVNFYDFRAFMIAFILLLQFIFLGYIWRLKQKGILR